MSSDKVEITQEELDTMYIVTNKKESKDKSTDDEVEITIEEEDAKLEEDFFNA